ncbi:MAG TPA: transketolase C-terminal domain-containing protein [Actinomycetota bacterium]|nr:transketolase C-terminal domain-containing protein [Actinomycetota bacterium]
MRGAFVRTLSELARADHRVVLLTGDLGFTVVEPFADEFPDRFFNVGVAEQNMVGLATGLAEAGFLPFCYSIATFAVLRPYEFIRNGPIAQQLPVRIVGVGGGFEYGSAGFTHYGLEDLGVLRMQPGITVVAPADAGQAAAALRATFDLPGPVYFRIGKDEKSVVAGLEARFRLGRAELVRSGRDVAVISVGAATVEAAAAVSELESAGVDAALSVVSTLNPAPVEDLLDLLEEVPAAVTVEGHYVTGGLGSLVAEVIAEHRVDCRLVRCGVRQLPHGTTGSTAFMQERHGLTAGAIASAAQEATRKALSPST